MVGIKKPAGWRPRAEYLGPGSLGSGFKKSSSRPLNLPNNV